MSPLRRMCPSELSLNVSVTPGSHRVVAVLGEREIGDRAAARRGAGLGLDVLGLDDVGLIGIQEAAAGCERQGGDQRHARVVHLSHGVVTPSQKPMLRRAVQYCTCGWDSKSLVAKLSCAKAFTSGSTPV